MVEIGKAAEESQLDSGSGGSGLGDLGAIYAELLDTKFDLAEFRQSLKAQAELVLQKSDADKTLRESLRGGRKVAVRQLSERR